jgi:hypothetical protein
MRRISVGLLNHLRTKTNANFNNEELAPSLAEADAILNQFGYVDAELLAA